MTTTVGNKQSFWFCDKYRIDLAFTHLQYSQQTITAVKVLQHVSRDMDCEEFISRPVDIDCVVQQPLTQSFVA